MKSLVRIGLLLVVIWVAAELYSQGTKGAFGGALERWSDGSEELEEGRKTSKAFQRAYDKSTLRVDRMLESEPGAGS